MKKILLLTLFVISFSLSAQVTFNPLILINGKVSDLEIKSIDPNIIKSISVLKDQAAIDAYGQAGKYGVISILTKETVISEINADQKVKPLVIVNGEVYTSGINSIYPNQIESITVLKNISATKAYGDAGKNGVILIKTKDEFRLKE
jgi:bla regulator protein blaR1